MCKTEGVREEWGSMEQAVKTLRRRTVDNTDRSRADYTIGLNLSALDDIELEQYMSAMDHTTLDIRISDEEVKDRKSHERATKAAYVNHRKKSISQTVRRVRNIFLFALAICFVTALFGLLVYNESQIASMNFANNKKERQINKMRQETSQLKENLFVNADLDSIRQLASMRLGMVEPSEKQIVNVVVPHKDHLTTNRSYNSVGLTEDIVEEAKRDLADYYSKADA